MSRVNAAVISTLFKVDNVHSENGIGLVLLLPLLLDSLAVLAQKKIQLGGFGGAMGAAFKGELAALPHNFVVGKDLSRKNICNEIDEQNKMTQTLSTRMPSKWPKKIFQIATSPSDLLVTWFAKIPEKEKQTNKQMNQNKVTINTVKSVC